MRCLTFWMVPYLALAAQDPTTLRIGTELVRVSVIAKDSDGKPVSDLRREDFQILVEAMGGTVNIGDARVDAGDILRGDADGIVALPCAQHGYHKLQTRAR